MMQPEILESPWSFYQDNMSPTSDQVELYHFNMNNHVDDCRFSTVFNDPGETSSEVCPNPFPSIPPTMFPNNHDFQYPIDEHTLQLPQLMEDFSMELDDFDTILSTHDDVVGIHGYGYLEESEGCFPSQQSFFSELDDSWSPTPSLKSELSSIQPSLIFPQEDMETDNQVSLPNLLEAFVEAMEQSQKALADVILRCMNQKVSPLGEPVEKLLFHLSQHMANNQGDYLKEEAFKNYEAAFRAFYQGLPIGKVAHFAAVSAILEAVPEDCEAIHVVDFDMGEGVQWPPMIEAIANQHRTLKITSIKWGEESSERVSTPWKFEETGRNLHEHARTCGLKLKVEEMGLEEMIAEIKKMNKWGGRREFLAFNIMVSLPHMGRGRSRRHAMEFLRVAKDLIKSSGNRGIITFGDGDAYEKLKNSLNLRSFFEGHVEHYRALLESIESQFKTNCFSEARAAMECLFVAPYMSSLGWLQKWEEMKNECHLQEEIGLDGCKLSKDILMELREMLRSESEGSYEARIEGQNGNELVLEWKGKQVTQLLRVSTWGNSS